MPSRSFAIDDLSDLLNRAKPPKKESRSKLADPNTTEGLLKSVFLNASRKKQERKPIRETQESMDSLFMQVFRKKSSSRDLDDLEYWDFYPRTVKQWVNDAKVPPIWYDEEGRYHEDAKGDKAAEEEEMHNRMVRGDPDGFGKLFLLIDRAHHRTEGASAESVDYMMPIKPGETGLQRVDMEVVKRMEPPMHRIALPKDLLGQYKWGITRGDVMKLGCSLKMKVILSFEFCNEQDINEFRIRRAIRKWQRFPGDTGSSEVQVAVLTERAYYLARHLQRHPKDKATQYGYKKLLGKRSRLLKYLKRRNIRTYFQLRHHYNIAEIKQQQQ